MSNKISLKKSARQIYDERSREYFSEVLSSYKAGNFRSSVVMLWSVAIFDLLIKLKYLVDTYKDKEAKAILDEIETARIDFPNNPKWEFTLVKSVFEKTKLLDNADYQHLLNLQKQRHLAAHPVVNARYKLHMPNLETTLALIRNTLDGLLTKDPILSMHIIEEILKDIENGSYDQMVYEKFKTYLLSTYFLRLNVNVMLDVFRELWVIVFIRTDKKSNKHRTVYYRTLRALYEHNTKHIKKHMEIERDFYSNIAAEGEPVVFLIHFLSTNKSIYDLLSARAKMSIEQVAASNSQARCFAWFLNKNLREHSLRLGEWICGPERPKIDPETWEEMEKLSDSIQWAKSMVRLANKYYATSQNYDTADLRFADNIRPKINSYQIDDCLDLIQGIKGNTQTSGRRLAFRDHRIILDQIRKLDPKFDFSLYPDVFGNLV